MTSRGASGDRLDNHNIDPTAHLGFGPKLVVPPAATFGPSLITAWVAVNQLIAMRFNLPASTTLRYVNLRVGTSSGNVQVGVAQASRSLVETSIYLTRYAHSGVIACPAGAATAKVDIGSTLFPPGEYALFLWCDNTTATFTHGIANDVQGSRAMFASVLSGGLPANLTEVSVSARWVSGLTLEAETY